MVHKISSCCGRQVEATSYRCSYCEADCTLVDIPEEALYMIEPGSIEWEMDWKGIDPKWQEKYPNKPEKEIIFEKDKAVALLIVNGVIFLNSHHWEKDWPEKARKATSMNVICNDIFAWGCSDAEEITAEGDEIKELYFMWKANPKWGAALWCMKKKREMPQDAVADKMVGDGIDLNSFKKEHNLRVNFYSGVSRVISKVKYGAYTKWAIDNSKEVKLYDKHWWSGWEEFIKANPTWEHQLDYSEIRKKFSLENGFE